MGVGGGWQYCENDDSVFLLDDHELVRTGLRTLLEAEDDMEVVGEVGTAEQGLRLIRGLVPDVAILDVRLPDGNGIEVCREVQSSAPQVRRLCSRRTRTTRPCSRRSWQAPRATS